jgi:hypothetical protein
MQNVILFITAEASISFHIEAKNLTIKKYFTAFISKNSIRSTL